eukprot:6708140-Karenia_brevis.AAC.1
MEDDSGATNKRIEPEAKTEKEIAQIVAETITAGRSAFYEVEKNEYMKKEAKLQAENDQAVLGHKEKTKPAKEEESKNQLKEVKRKFEMPT